MKQAKTHMESQPTIKKLFIYATIHGNRHLLEFREFDEKGNITTEIAFYEDGSVYEKVVHTYIGDKVVQSNYFSENEKASHTVSFGYDDDGHIIKESTWYADGSLTIKTIERNVAELSDTIVTRDEDGTVEGKTYHQFNEAGKPILEIIYDDDGQEEVERTSFQYTDSDLPLRIEAHSADGSKPFIRDFDYVSNDRGELAATYIRDENGNVMGSENRTFDEKGNVTSLEEINHYTGQYRQMEWDFDDKNHNNAIRQFDRHGNLTVEILLKYNDYGQIIHEETRATGQGMTLKEYVYEYYSS